MDINAILEKLVSSLKPVDPYKIVLFGSYANGNPNEHSDVDIMVILDNDHVSKTFEERLEKKYPSEIWFWKLIGKYLLISWFIQEKSLKL